jgi:sugar phosphate isomerase/epimerase
MIDIPIALQLYSVREDCARNLNKTIESVADIGYEGVEFAGFYGRRAKDLKAILDDVGLKVAGTHTKLDSLLGIELRKTVEFNKTLGNEFVIVPTIPRQYRDVKNGWGTLANLLNRIAEKIKPNNMRVGYHNHTFEFKPMNEDTPFNILFKSTKLEVIMQLDTGHAMHAGADPTDILKNFPGRAITVHIKDYSAVKNNILVGEGRVQFDKINRLCKKLGGTKWYIIEQETYPYPPLESARLSLENLKKIIR